MEQKSHEYTQRLEKLKALRAMDIDPYPNDFKPSNTCADVIKRFGNLSKEELEGSKETVSIAGRIMALRDFGKASFIQIQDFSSRLQAYVKKDLMGSDGYQLFKHMDVGDIAGISGAPFRTKTDELTIEVKGLRLLSKGLSPLPEKWHGLKDIEARYRQRYLDIMVNTEVRDVFLKRTAIVGFIRNFLSSKGFIEVETPMLQPIHGGATAKPFTTRHNALDMELCLRIAPELYLKRLLIAGFERVFEINRNFRNEGVSTQHNPEFTMLEFYQAYATYEDLMDLTEEMLSALVKNVSGTFKLKYQDIELDFTPPWTRITVRDAVLKYSNAGPDIFSDAGKALSFAKSIGIDLPKGVSHGIVITEIFEKTAERQFVQPTFVTQYPVEVSPLARRNRGDESVVDRFELLVAGREIANAFSELNDPVDQRERFAAQLREREAGMEETHPMDEDFVRAMEYGMPPAAGQGIGIDRLVMLLTDSASIRDVILFPLLKRI
ncbi:MAG: lysine--tRNA ligase [Deltaproteobacteria bacterium]|nr:lysine--tRNA ligase [Deltaproteobacteria bacterium]